MRLFMGLICVIAVLITLGFVLVTYRPAGYRPFPPADDEEVNQYLTHELAPAFYNGINCAEPFNVDIDQDKLNQLIADGRDLGWDWPVMLNGVTFSAPMVQLDDEFLALMGQVDIGIPVIVTIRARPHLDDNGLLTLNLDQVKAGAINVTGLAKGIAGQIMATEAAQLEESQWLEDLAGACLENRPYDPRFPVPPERVYIRLTHVEMAEGRLQLRFEPAGKMD